MKRDTIVQLIAAALLVLCIGGSSVLALSLAASAGRNKLVYAERATESDPPQVAAGIAMGAFRGLFVNMLWIRANALKEDGRFYESMDLARAITKLQPRFPQVWVFHAWNMAYNISVSTQTQMERWQWVNAGINLLRDQGIPANPNDLLLHRELAWIFLHKIGGYMDDANVFYKRQLAAEWTELLGPPPKPDPLDRNLEHATQKYLDWLRPIVEAPENPQDVVKAEPAAAELVNELRAKTGFEPGADLVRAYTRAKFIIESGVRSWFEARMSPREVALLALVGDPRYKAAWDALMPYLRRRALVDIYHMEPERMYRYTQTFGPIDWRHHAAHGLYWSQRGYEHAQTRWEAHNRKDFDFTNAGRIVIQSLQELWRSGDITFDFLAYVRNPFDPSTFFRGSPNVHFIETYGQQLEKYIKDSEFDSKKRVYGMYSAGYENFRKDAIRFLYRRGEKERATKMKDDLAVWEWQNFNDNTRKDLFKLSLDDFVRKELEEQALTRPSVAREEAVGAIQGAFVQGLLAGDMELYNEQIQYARWVHSYFFSRQSVRNQINPNQLRMAQMDPDFLMLLGTEFAALISRLDISDAEVLYDNAAEDIRRFAYDVLAENFRDVLDNQAREGKGRPFNEIFPEPPEMQAHRAEMQRKARELGNLPGVELK